MKIRELILESLPGLIKPLVRFLLRQGITLRDFEEAAKTAFVSVADDEIQARGEKPNASRISAMIGLNRNDVGRIHRAPLPKTPRQSLPGRVVVQWERDSRFADPKRGPKPLHWRGEDDQFAALVQSVSTHANPASVLFELERLGMVVKNGDVVELKTAEYRPNADYVQGMRILSRDFASLVNAVDENLRVGKSVNLHLHTEFDRIRERDMETIRTWIINEGREFHRRVREYLSGFDADITPLEEGEEALTRGKVSLGAFGFLEVNKGGPEAN